MSENDPATPFSICCPLCRGTLTVDRSTGHILHAAAPRGDAKSFESALGAVKSAESRREQDFLDAFQREATRRDLLDKKFDTAKEKAEKDPKPHVNPLDAD